MEFAERHLKWIIADWKDVMGPNGTKIDGLGSDDRAHVWKNEGESLSNRDIERTVKSKGRNQIM